MTMEIDKSRFRDDNNRYIVQGLFLEDRYNTKLAVYTLAGEDKEYKGITFPSLKRLFLEEGDPTEYLFAKKHLYDWGHWQRLCKNAVVSRHIEEWRNEMELGLRAEGIQSLIDAALSDNHYQAAKWLADKGWDVKKRGRPSKEELEGELKRKVNQDQEFLNGAELLKVHKGGK